jgi:hypothetical protein
MTYDREERESISQVYYLTFGISSSMAPLSNYSLLYLVYQQKHTDHLFTPYHCHIIHLSCIDGSSGRLNHSTSFSPFNNLQLHHRETNQDWGCCIFHNTFALQSLKITTAVRDQCSFLWFVLGHLLWNPQTAFRQTQSPPTKPFG